MTHERIIELWEQAGFIWGELGVRDRLCIAEFVSLIRADEREACAKVCDEVDRRWINQADKCAQAIRSRNG